MTTQINGGDHFRHISMLRLRQILKAWESNSNLYKIGDHSKVQLSDGGVFAILHEALEEGLLSKQTPPGYPDAPESLQLTDQGEAIANASARKRSTKRSGQRILDQIIEAIERINSNPHTVTVIDKLWVFGSFIDPGKTDIGDLDVSIEISHTGLYKKHALDFPHYTTNFPELNIQNVTPFFLAPFKFVQRAVFGVKRNPLVSPMDIGELVDLHVPCVLAFDRKLGRLPLDRVLPHHPRSIGRADRFGERLTIPVLGPIKSNFRPSNSVILEEHVSNAWYSGHVEICFQQLPDGLAVRSSTSPDLNGQENFAIAIRNSDGGYKPFFAIVSRATTLEEDDWTYNCNVTMHCAGNAPPEDFADIDKRAIADIVRTTVGADMHRLAWLRRDNNLAADIRMNICVDLDEEDYPELRETIHEQAGLNIHREETPLPYDLFYGIMILDEEQRGGGSGHFFEMDDEELDDLPPEFPMSKDAIMSHPSYRPWNDGDGEA